MDVASLLKAPANNTLKKKKKKKKKRDHLYLTSTEAP